MLWSQGCWRHLLYGEGDRSASHGAGRRRRQCVVRNLLRDNSAPRGPDASETRAARRRLSSGTVLLGALRRRSLRCCLSLIVLPCDGATFICHLAGQGNGCLYDSTAAVQPPRCNPAASRQTGVGPAQRPRPNTLLSPSLLINHPSQPGNNTIDHEITKRKKERLAKP